MNAEITCQQCKHIFSSPLILNCCSTSICSTCLSNISYKKDSNSTQLYYNCPFCSKESEDIETATSNDFLAGFIEYSRSQGKSAQSSCERCEKQTKYDQIIICNECNNKNLCKECSDSIHSVGRFKTHERTPYVKGIMHQLKCITNLMHCQVHLKEKLEYICVKDTQFLCNQCIAGHKQNCKNSIITIREAYKDILYQVQLKSEKLKTTLLSVKSEDDSLRKAVEKLEENCERSKQAVRDQFTQLYTILEQKQKEIEFSIEYISVQKKGQINQEIKENEGSCLWIENIIDILDFANSYQNSSFIAGTKYLFTRIDSLMNIINSKKSAASLDLTTPTSLQYLEDCKMVLSRICLTTLPPSNPEKPKSRLTTPRVNTPSATPPRSNTPQTSKTARCETPTITHSPLSRNKETSKSQRSAFRSSVSTGNKNGLDTSINNFNLACPSDKQEVQVVSSRPPVNRQLQETLDSPRFSNSESTFRGMDDEDEVITNHVKIPKKPLRLNTGPSSTLANYLSSLGANNSSLCTDHGINLQNAFVKGTDAKHKKHNLSDIKRKLNESKEEGNSNVLCDVNHLTELQKNPLVKRMFTKISQTATTIFVAWTHPFNTANLLYQLEYGIGSKVQGVEQFRPVFKGPLHSCIISDLMPKTSYRIRVCSIQIKSKENESGENSPTKGKREVVGEWSDVITVATKESQTIDAETLGSHAKMAARGGDKVQVEFDKSGTIAAANGYTYGKVAWEVKFQQQAAHQMPDDTNAFIKIGVMSKSGKQPYVFGTMINYGLNPHSSTVNILLDLENRTMTVQCSSNSSKEVINNLPDGPLYPAFQNKTNKNTNFPLKLFVHFDLPVK